MFSKHCSDRKHAESEANSDTNKDVMKVDRPLEEEKKRGGRGSKNKKRFGDKKKIGKRNKKRKYNTRNGNRKGLSKSDRNSATILSFNLSYLPVKHVMKYGLPLLKDINVCACALHASLQ